MKSTTRPVALAAFLLLLHSPAFAATVRGQLACAGGKSLATGVAVTLYSQQKVRTVPAFTGGDGMYYFNNIAAGAYTLEVWLSKNGTTPSVTYQMVVKEPSTDFPRATLAACSAQ